MTVRKPRRTKEEMKVVKEEYARLLGPACVALANRLHLTVDQLQEQIDEFNRSRAACNVIRDI